MSEIVNSVFQVKIANEKQICLKEQNNGFSVFVEPANNQKYNDKIRTKINNLEREDTIKAILKSQNKLLTIWTFESIKHI